MKDPTSNPAEGNRLINKPFAPYIKQLPTRKPGDVFARDTGLYMESVLPRNPEQWKNNFMTVYTSASHTYGNAISAVEQFIIDIFPEGLFKSVHTAKGSANRQLTSTPAQLVKKKYPMIVTHARIDYGQDGNRSMANTLLTDRQADFQMTWGLGNLQPFMNDRAHNYKVEWFLNKWILNIDFILVFNTINEQINWMNYLQNSIKIQHPFIIDRPLEAVMPKPLIDEISFISGIPVYDKTGSVGRFLQYMQSVSNSPITFKLKGGSGNDEFFRYYRAEIDTTISPPDPNEGTRSSQTNRLYEITFTARCEFNGVGYFFMSSPNIRYKSNKPIMPVENETTVCHYTDDLNYRVLNIPNGWSVLATPSFQFASYDDNVIPLQSVLDEKLTKLIDIFVSNRMDPGLFISVEFRRRSSVIELRQKWRMDWKNKQIVFEEVDLHETYRMLILVDQNYIHNLEKRIWGVE
jgi:hypothetical protein